MATLRYGDVVESSTTPEKVSPSTKENIKKRREAVTKASEESASEEAATPETD